LTELHRYLHFKISSQILQNTYSGAAPESSSRGSRTTWKENEKS